MDFKWLQDAGRFDSLDLSAQFIIQRMAESQLTIGKQLENQTKQFVSLQERSELRIVEEHEIRRAEVKQHLTCSVVSRIH
jgi:hypothetical protein